jgi:hypothetical protein
MLWLHVLYFSELCGGWDSVVGIATRYGLDSPGLKSWRGRDFPDPSRPSPRSTQPLVQWVAVDHPIPRSAGSSMGRAVPLPTLCACLACNGSAFNVMHRSHNCKKWIRKCICPPSIMTSHQNCSLPDMAPHYHVVNVIIIKHKARIIKLVLPYICHKKKRTFTTYGP